MVRLTWHWQSRLHLAWEEARMMCLRFQSSQLRSAIRNQSTESLPSTLSRTSSSSQTLLSRSRCRRYRDANIRFRSWPIPTSRAPEGLLGGALPPSLRRLSQSPSFAHRPRYLANLTDCSILPISGIPLHPGHTPPITRQSRRRPSDQNGIAISMAIPERRSRSGKNYLWKRRMRRR